MLELIPYNNAGLIWICTGSLGRKDWARGMSKFITVISSLWLVAIEGMVQHVGGFCRRPSMPKSSAFWGSETSCLDWGIQSVARHKLCGGLSGFRSGHTFVSAQQASWACWVQSFFLNLYSIASCKLLFRSILGAPCCRPHDTMAMA